MKISSIPVKQSSQTPNYNNRTKDSNISFKSIYVENDVNLGDAAEGTFPARFSKKDALLLNAISNQYPNQDCFIRSGYAKFPRLEFREVPPQVQVFQADMAKQYKTVINTVDKEYPCEPMLLYGDMKENDSYKDPRISRIIGATSYISINPSLSYTVKLGYELHKKLLEKKYQIMQVIGKNDDVDLGKETITKTAHKYIEKTEIAVIRYLMECALQVLKDKPSSRQIYSSNYLKAQSILDKKRTYDLTTSVAKQEKPERSDIDEIDIDEIENFYGNSNENLARIKLLKNIMIEKGLVLA